MMILLKSDATAPGNLHSNQSEIVFGFEDCFLMRSNSHVGRQRGEIWVYAPPGPWASGCDSDLSIPAGHHVFLYSSWFLGLDIFCS